MIIRPAATVLTIREIPEGGIELLLLKRNRALAFAPNAWVFPGGRIDEADGSLSENQILQTARIAGAREASEEANLTVHPKDLHHYCHWTTPVGANRRYATWFFHTKTHYRSKVRIDESEIVDHLWVSPRDALVRMTSASFTLLPPTFISIERIKNAASYADVITEFNRTGIITAAPVTDFKDGKFYCLYKGDAGFETKDITATGPSHRLIVDQAQGVYHFEYKDCSVAPVNGGVF